MTFNDALLTFLTDPNPLPTVILTVEKKQVRHFGVSGAGMIFWFLCPGVRKKRSPLAMFLPLLRSGAPPGGRVCILLAGFSRCAVERNRTGGGTKEFLSPACGGL